MKNLGVRLFLVLDALLLAALAWLWLDHRSAAPRSLAWQPPAAIAQRQAQHLPRGLTPVTQLQCLAQHRRVGAPVQRQRVLTEYMRRFELAPAQGGRHLGWAGKADQQMLERCALMGFGGGRVHGGFLSVKRFFDAVA